jgi:hypothetical protein
MASPFDSRWVPPVGGAPSRHTGTGGAAAGVAGRCACLDAKTRVLAVGALASTTCNNFISDLLFLSEVSHSLLVAGAPCVHPDLGKWALGVARWTGIARYIERA